MRFVAATAVAALLAVAAPAQASETLTTSQAGQVVDALVDSLRGYFDPTKAARVQAALRADRERLSQIHDRATLAEALSAITLGVSGDRHLKVSVTTASAQAPALSDAEQARLDQRLAYGLMSIRRLPGNIGYLKLRYFEQTPAGAALIDSAMGMLQHTDALIIDLRENTGGGGAADERLLGHLAHDPIVMAQLRWRRPGGREEIQQRKVSTPETGPLYPDKPLFVLTAHRTFSAAEEFAYDIQANRRGLLIGARTRGGGNPSDRPAPPLGFGLTVFVPNGQAVHPVTGKSWEGVGVQPDVETTPESALTEAYRRALAVAKPKVSTPRSDKEREDAMADPAGALLADQKL